jgi:peptidoglycan/xylan/chitin deacetylase (PgdA/CDA1 family)
MLKFWPVTAFYVMAAVGLAALQAPFLAWLFLVLSYTFAVTYGSANIDSGFFVKTICRGNPLQKTVALTFDDGPDFKNTPLILDFLKKEGIKATFFCIGEKIEQNPDLALRINNEGHIIGNHSYSHSNFFPVKPVLAIRQELTKTRKIIEDLTQKPNLYFRPPFGVTNPLIKKALKGLNFKVIGWNIRSFDLSNDSSEKIAKRIISKLRGGDIILLHDTSRQVLPVLVRLLEHFNENGWKVVSLEDLIKEN